MAKVLSSISGNLISAASAGYAPTNSGDVSAIASGYQVVSATGTQLYAGTAYLTGVNSTPISAERAGKAANASMATSAYYDGTGRLISALPDSAAVSSIASGYATAKQDASAMTAYAKSADVSGTVNTVVNNSANWNSVYTTVSSNSASWSGSTGGGSVTSPSGTIFVSGDKIEGTNSAVQVSTGGGDYTAELTRYPSTYNIGSDPHLLTTDYVDYTGCTLTIKLYSQAYTDFTAILSGRDPQNQMASASAYTPYAATAITIPMGNIVSGISGSASIWIDIDYAPYTARKTGMPVVTGIGELAWKSAVDNVTNTVSSNSATWGQGGVDSATVSSIASSYAESAISSVSGNYYSTSNPAGYITGVDLSNYATTGYVDSSVSSKANSSALSSYALSSDVSGCIDTVSSNSASWGAGVSLPIIGSAGSDSATYGETSVEFTRYDTAGEPDIRTATLSPDALDITYTVDENDYYSVHINENGVEFSDPDGYYTVTPYDITTWNSAVETVSNNSASWGQGGVDSATVSAIASSYVESGVSSKADSSALSSYALSADVSGTVDVVSSQSANWGGSALALSAGPGVKLEKVGNTLVASTDETVLWSGSAALTTAEQTISLSEPCTNFASIKIYGESWVGWTPTLWGEASGSEPQFTLVCPYMGAGGDAIRLVQSVWRASGTDYKVSNCKVFSLQGATASTSNPTNTWARLVVGVNRTAGV